MFFAIVFPLMFLVLFGGIFAHQSQSRIDLIEVGRVSLLEQLPPSARTAFDATFHVTHSDDLAGSIAKVRKGDADVALEAKGDALVAHYTNTDQVKAGETQGVLQAFVDGTNVGRVTRQAADVSLQTESVEDDSLKVIQYVTPGLLGWAVAMSASFGAAATLNGWRNSKLLRRLQLAPVPTGTVVGARVAVTVAIALGQLAIFLGLGAAAFGLQLTGAWRLRSRCSSSARCASWPSGCSPVPWPSRPRARSSGQLHRAADGVPVAARSSRSTARPAGSRRSRDCCRCAG